MCVTDREVLDVPGSTVSPPMCEQVLSIMGAVRAWLITSLVCLQQ